MFIKIQNFTHADLTLYWSELKGKIMGGSKSAKDSIKSIDKNYISGDDIGSTHKRPTTMASSADDGDGIQQHQWEDYSNR